jgi:hypothetical protein
MPSRTLADADGGTDLVGVHEGRPSGVSTAGNETGWQMVLAERYSDAGVPLRRRPSAGFVSERSWLMRIVLPGQLQP